MHADSLREMADGLTLDGIYEVTVLWEPLSFESAEAGFSTNACFDGALGCEGVEDFVAVIEREVAELRGRGVGKAPSVVRSWRATLPCAMATWGRGKMHRHRVCADFDWRHRWHGPSGVHLWLDVPLASLSDLVGSAVFVTIWRFERF